MSDDHSGSSKLSSIRAHLFSFLFGFATASLTLWLAYSENNSWHPYSVIFISLFMGQLWWAGTWAAVAKIHRLWRALLLIAAIILMTMAVLFNMTPRERIEGAAMGLAASCVIAASALVAALALRFSLSRTFRRSATSLRFPMKELVAWTTLCAVAAWGLASADFSYWQESYEATFYIVVAGMLAGVAATIHLCPTAMKLRYKMMTTIALFACLWAMKMKFDSSIEPTVPEGAIGGYVYLLIAVVVMKIDRRFAARDLLQRPSWPTIR